MLGWLRRIAKGAAPRSAGNGEVEGIPLDLAAVPGAIELADGLPRPRWDVIRAAAAALAGRYEPHRVWCEIERQWLEALVAALGDPYRIVETRSVLLLCARATDDAASLARLCENTLSTVHSILGDPPARCGKLPVFVFDSPETYYTYAAHFYADGEYGTSGGMCFRDPDGDVHVATVDTDYGLEQTLAHEMVHARLEPGMPVWVEEGAAEVISRHVARAAPLVVDAAGVRRQRHHWRKHGLDAFWFGEAFQRGDRGQPLSYELADVLVQNLLSGHRRALPAFLREARAADAGEAAARQHLGLGLADLAAQFLGEGDGAPTCDSPDAPAHPAADP